MCYISLGRSFPSKLWLLSHPFPSAWPWVTNEQIPANTAAQENPCSLQMWGAGERAKGAAEGRVAEVTPGRDWFSASPFFANLVWYLVTNVLDNGASSSSSSYFFKFLRSNCVSPLLHKEKLFNKRSQRSKVQSYTCQEVGAVNTILNLAHTRTQTFWACYLTENQIQGPRPHAIQQLNRTLSLHGASPNYTVPCIILLV